MTLTEKQCKRLNEAEGNLQEQDGIECKVCRNKGEVYFVRDEKYLTVKECECMKRRRTIKRAIKSGLFEALKECKLENFETQEAWQLEMKSKAYSFCTDENARWFYIGGQPGCGKTFICTAICGKLIKQGKECRYMLWRDEAVKLKASVTEMEYQKEMDELKAVEVLYIDDFLKTTNGGEPTQGDMNIAFELLNHRMLDKSKRTILSSEYPIQEALRFDEATISRIFERAGVYKISIGRDISKNYRMREQG